MRPGPGITEPSLAMFERLVGNFDQRAPLAVPGLGWPMSVAHASGTTGSTTTFVLAGTLATSQSRVALRVSVRDSVIALCSEYTTPWPRRTTAPRAATAGASAGTRRPATWARRTIA